MGHKAKWEYFRAVYERYHKAGRNRQSQPAGNRPRTRSMVEGDKADELMSIHEHLPPDARKELKKVRWT